MLLVNSGRLVSAPGKEKVIYMMDILWKVFIALGLVVGSIMCLSIIAFIVQCGIDAVREAREEDEYEQFEWKS